MKPAMAPLHQELRHLAAGKALSALLGLVVLALLWRRVTPQAYGQYLSLVAALEILTLGSALGLSTIAQRHLPIWMVHARSSGRALWAVAQVLGLRALMALLALLTLAALAEMWAPGGALVETHRLDAHIPAWPHELGLHWGLTWVLAGVLVRSLEEIQSVLLMQAWVQAQAVAAQTIRLLALSSTPAQAAQGLQWLITLELGIALLMLFVGAAAVVHRTLQARPQDDPLRQEPPTPWPRAWAGALGFWLIQCLGLGWSLHALRLVLHALAGPTAVAVHAAAQALCDSLRQASPLVWMAGWLRAAMLRLHALGSTSNQALHLATAVERVSAVLMWPVLAAWCVEPAAWLRWAAGPELFAQAQRLSLSYPLVPAFTGLLLATALLVPLQNRHLVLTLWTQTRQQPGWGIVASFAALLCATALPWLLPMMGLWSVPLVMIGAELLWVATVGLRWLDDEGPGRLLRMGRSALVPVAALGAAWLASVATDQSQSADGWPQLLCPLLAAGAAVCTVIWKWPAWSSGERAVLSRCLPPLWGARWLKWSGGTWA